MARKSTMLYSRRPPTKSVRTYSSPNVKAGTRPRWRRPARCSTSRLMAGAPARGPVSWTSCASAAIGTVRSTRARRAFRSPDRILMSSSLRQLVVEGEREEDREPHVEHDVVHERGALLEEGRLVARVLGADRQGLELLQED